MASVFDLGEAFFSKTSIAACLVFAKSKDKVATVFKSSPSQIQVT